MLQRLLSPEMNKKELLSMLEEFNHFHPGKVLGQNFLIDKNLLDFIIRTADPQPEEIILEVGPGFGALTRRLLEPGSEVYSIEFDYRICEFLRKHLPQSNFHLIEGDACRVDFSQFLPPGKPFRSVANLPYSISSIFLARLLEMETPPLSMLFMLQKEMGMRLAAGPGTGNYGSLSVRTQLLYDVKLLRTVPPQVFFPQPEVESAIVQFKLKSAIPDMESRLQVNELAKVVFAQKRKQIFKPLQTRYERQSVENALDELGIAREARPADFNADTYLKLAKLLNK
jgi:16S rRNA (adenine1518-N6/adenine1519-N6)-dimethyltransferase